MSISRRALLEAWAAEHLAAHGCDPEKSLAAFDLDRSTRESLAAAGPEVEATLAHLGSGSGSNGAAAGAASDATGEYTPTPARAGTSDHQLFSGPGTVVAGRYTLAEKLGEGGMGEVWVASQSEPVKRKVALKLIKTGMDSRAVLQRFEQERQALAVMDHPNIAKVLDGGLADSGRPYFAMELVAGQTLTRFCDDAKLSVRQRLELFVPICQAVQHAHQKGSSTATSSRPTCWSPSWTADPSPRSSTSAWPRRSLAS